MGFRWLNLTDRLTGYEEASNPSYGYDYAQGRLSSRNQRQGGQVGAEGLLYGKRDQGFSIDGSVKAGVFQNNISNKGSDAYSIQ